MNGTGQADTLAGTDLPENIFGKLGADTLTGGGGSDDFLFTPGSANSDVITAFTGNGPTAGDRLAFVGFGAGASFAMTDATHGAITYSGGVEVITFANAPTIVHAPTAISNPASI